MDHAISLATGPSAAFGVQGRALRSPSPAHQRSNPASPANRVSAWFLVHCWLRCPIKPLAAHTILVPWWKVQRDLLDWSILFAREAAVIQVDIKTHLLLNLLRLLLRAAGTQRSFFKLCAVGKGPSPASHLIHLGALTFGNQHRTLARGITPHLLNSFMLVHSTCYFLAFSVTHGTLLVEIVRPRKQL